jgi:hypothetical protein
MNTSGVTTNRRGAGVSIGCVVGLVLGCGSSPSGNPSVLIRDENNYLVTAALSIPSVDTAPGVDLDLCWSHATNDLQCHPLAPQSDVDTVSVLRISRLAKHDVERKLSAGQLSQSHVAGYVEYQPDHVATCTKLSQLSFFGTAIDIASEYTETPANTYLLLLAKGTTPGVGARDMLFLNPTAASTNTTVDVAAGCGLLDFSADLLSLKKPSVPIDPPWMIDWEGITHDGQGNAVSLRWIDGVTIGRFDGMTAEALQARLLDIEFIATSLWDLPLDGEMTADLSLAHDRKTGAPFSGFQPANSTWMLALTCSACQSPAPLVLTIVQPR